MYSLLAVYFQFKRRYYLQNA